jgi:small-conductance mechanosensitive channel
MNSDPGQIMSVDNIVAAAVRQTAVTLAHHINNQLMVVETTLSLMAEKLSQQTELPVEKELQQMIAQSQEGTERITAVLKVLQQITDIEPVAYADSTQMLDIKAALERELNGTTSRSERL